MSTLTHQIFLFRRTPIPESLHDKPCSIHLLIRHLNLALGSIDPQLGTELHAFQLFVFVGISSVELHDFQSSVQNENIVTVYSFLPHTHFFDLQSVRRKLK